MRKFHCRVGSWGGLIYNDEFTVVAKDRKEAEEVCLKRILIALIVFSALIIYIVKACQSYCGPNDVLHLRKKRRIVNGEILREEI